MFVSKSHWLSTPRYQTSTQPNTTGWEHSWRSVIQSILLLYIQEEFRNLSINVPVTKNIVCCLHHSPRPLDIDLDCVCTFSIDLTLPHEAEGPCELWHLHWWRMILGFGHRTWLLMKTVLGEKMKFMIRNNHSLSPFSPATNPKIQSLPLPRLISHYSQPIRHHQIRRNRHSQLLPRKNKTDLINLNPLLLLKCLLYGQDLILGFKVEGLLSACESFDEDLCLVFRIVGGVLGEWWCSG